MQTFEGDTAGIELQSARLRRLARALVGDPHAADDLVQESWLAALEQPPARTRALGGWLAGTLRHLVQGRRRRDARRDEHERRAAASERHEPGGSDLERVETLEVLLGEIKALGEPYRSVIVQRFLDGLSPREIAERKRIPVRTVNTQVSRALARLRERLDRGAGGRERWLGALLPLAAGPRGPLIGVLLVNSKSVVAGAFAVLALLGAAWFVRRASPTVASLPAPQGPDKTLVAAPSEGGAGSRATAGAEAPVPVPGAVEVPAADGALHGVVVDVGDRPLTGVRVVFRRVRGGPSVDGCAATSGEDGRFRLAAPDGAGVLDVAGDKYATLLEPRVIDGERGGELVLVVAPRWSLSGRVLDAAGKPLQAASLRLSVPSVRTRILRITDASANVDWRTTTDADGRFALDSAPDLPGAKLVTTCVGYQKDERDLIDAQPADVAIVLEPLAPTADRVLGRVVDREGKPIAGAYVTSSRALDGQSTRSDRLGAFELEYFAATSEPPVITALVVGYLPGRIEAERAESGWKWPDPLEVRVGEPALAIEGRVLDANGVPVPGAELEILDRTRIPWWAADDGSQYRHDLEAALAGRGPGAHTQADAEGRFAVRGLSDREYRLRCFDRRTLSSFDAAPIRAGTQGVEIRIPAEPRFARVAGRVVDARGTPVRGAKVTLLRPSSYATTPDAYGDPLAMNEPLWLGDPVATDADGRFELRDVSRTLSRVWATQSQGVISTSVDLAPGTDVEALELVVRRICHAQIDLADSAEKALFVFIEDPASPHSWVTFVEGGRTFSTAQVQLIGGRSAPFQVFETATNAVVYGAGSDGQWKEVQRIPLSLDPERLNVIRP